MADVHRQLAVRDGEREEDGRRSGKAKFYPTNVYLYILYVLMRMDTISPRARQAAAEASRLKTQHSLYFSEYMDK